MERKEAIEKLNKLIDQNLHDLAKIHNITVLKPDGRENKGWAGHVCERCLELPLNSSQSPNFGSWELKCIPIKTLRNGRLAFKETMAITMIDKVNVLQKSFEDSHLLSKIRKAVIVARTVGKDYSQPSYILDVFEIDIDEDHQLYETVKDDYNLVRKTIEEKGFEKLSGKLGTYIQPRTKGAGHGSTSRAFYARKSFLAELIDLNIYNQINTD